MKQRRRAGRFLGLLLALVMLLSVGMQAFAADADVTGAMTGQRTGTEAAGTETDAAGKNGTESKTEESEESGTETKPEESGESGTETKPEDGTESASESEMAGLNAVSPEAADSEGDFSNIGDLTFVSETGTADYSLNQTVQNLLLTTGASYDLAVYAGGAALGRNYSVSWESADSSTASVNSSGMITARQTGQTTVMATVTDRSGSAVGRLTIQVTVIDDGNGQYSREIEFYVADIQNTTLYYVENGHTGQFDFISVEEGTVIYGQTSGKWNLVYFAAPDEGYALTYLSAVNNYGQTDWTSIRNGQLVNPNNNYFETAYGTQYYNEVLQTAQGTYGCDGCFWFTRGNDESSTGACRSYIIAISEKLPTVEKTVAQVNGQTYTDGMEIHVGDTITFGVTVTRYESQYGISYSGAALNDTLSGACFQNSSSARKDISADLGSSTTAAGTYTYYVDYTVQEADLDTQIVNTVELSYSYRAQYSEGEYGGTAQAQARVSVLSFTPDDYIIDFGSPISLDFTGKSSYDFVSGNATFGTVAVNGKTVTYTPSSVLTEADTVTITNEKGAEFSFTVYPASNVYYEEGFASYSGAWTGGSSATADQTVSAVNDSTEDLYGYDSLYAAANGSSNDSLAVSSTANAAATFTFHGTGLDIYALTTQTSGSMSLWLYEGTGTDGTLLKLGYVNTSNNWLEGNDGNYYNTPVFSYTDLAAGTYTVKIVVTGGTVSLDGFRVYHTQGDAYETVYSQDQENAAQTVELRDIVIAGSTYDFNDVEDWYTYGNQIIDAVYNENGNGSGALILARETRSPQTRT